MKRLPADAPAAREERPGQRVPPHHNKSTVMVQVVSGAGVFSGDDGDTVLRAGQSAVYQPGETHAIEATDEPLHFLALLAPSP